MQDLKKKKLKFRIFLVLKTRETFGTDAKILFFLNK